MEFKTTFWQDFNIADCFGLSAIQDTYKRAFNEWKDNYEYLTELVLVLNLEAWQHYDLRNKEYSEFYTNLYHKTDSYALDNLKGKELEYYLRVTD